MTASFDYLLKLIVIGDSGVGKSCSVMQLIEKKIIENYDVTVGVQFGARSIDIDHKRVKLQIWDTAGQENFRSITRSYYRNAIGALLFYDITRRKTFDHVKNWLDEVSANGTKNMQVLLVGNKSDLESQRDVTSQEGQKMADEHEISFVECSSYNYDLVQKAYVALIRKIVQKIEKNEIPSTAPGIKISNYVPSDSQDKKKCCSVY